MRWWRTIEDQLRQGSVGIGPQGQIPFNGESMAAKKRSKSKSERARKASPAVRRFPVVLSTALYSVVNMTVTAVTSGSVLLCLFVAKRLL
jgi:hypothetical protein